MPYLVFAAIFGALYYVFTPQLALDNLAFLVTVAIAGLVPVIGLAVFSANTYTKPKVNHAMSTTALVGLLALGLALVQAFASAPMFRASSYQQLLGPVEVRDFKTSLPPLDISNAPLVSADMAVRAAEKMLSTIPALGSQAEVGTMEKQLVDGKLYWIGFLEHRGFWRWVQTSGTPGYVRVSAMDPSDVELVTEVAGKKMQLRYLPSAFFGQDAKRYLRMNGYATKGLGDFIPEVDDEGRPFLVASVFERKVGVAGKDVVGFVALDVQSGQSQYYAVGDAPLWVDRLQDDEIIKEQLDDSLEYVHGWFNPSHTDMLSVSGTLDVIYGTDGRAHYFAGLASTAREGGVVGFVLIDSRTKAVHRYNLAGVAEPVAQQAAEGVFPEKRYSATNALPFMVEGVPSYVMALRDGTGIPRSYGVVDITDFQKVAVADTLDGAVRAFQAKLNLDRTHTSAVARADEVVLKAKVLRAGAEVRGGVSNYVFVLEGQGSRLFTADVNRSEELSVTQAGDMVEVRTLQAQQRVQPVLQFKNLSLEALKTVVKTEPASAPAP